MNRTCPKCSSKKTYVADINGKTEQGDLIIMMSHRCTSCKNEWESEQESYAKKKNII